MPADFAPETLGTIVRADGYLEARLERNLDHDQDAVWQMLTLRIPAEEDIARTRAGWEAHLAMLIGTLDGAPIVFPFERFQAAREAYKLFA